VVIGLCFAVVLGLLGVGAGRRQLATLKRVSEEPYMAVEDRHYFLRQARRRLGISALMLIVGGMIAVYYLSGMDARMDAIPERLKQGGQPLPDDPRAREDLEFTRFVAIYWAIVIAMLGVVLGIAVVDVWATRKYWAARYQEIKADHETKLQRDLAVYRQQKLNERVKGLKKPDADTESEGAEGG
jgi:hypothetical protein